MPNKILATKKLGQQIKQKRLTLGLTQEELALKSGLSRSYISEVELGKRNISLNNIEKIAIALKVPIANLLE